MGESDVKQNIKKFMKDDVLKLQSRSSPPSIYKVPKELRNGHHEIFNPVSVPIGPLHYDAECPAQQLKKWCLKNFIERYGDEDHGPEIVAECLSQLEPEVRLCYKDIDAVGSEKLVKIMLLDGCFIMELLWNMDEINYDTERKPFDSLLDAVPFLTLQQDLLKIENQLPFIVLKNLTRLAPIKKKINKPTSNKQRNNNKDINLDQYLIQLALNFFEISTPTKTYTPETPPRHLLELVMNALFLNTSISSVSINMQNADGDGNAIADARSASELEYYGVRFHAADPRNMSNIVFSSSSGHFKMPKLNIQESTLWNLLVFEMLSCITRVVSSYVVLMGTLIENEKDVEVLLGSKILASRGSDARTMVSLFTELSATVNKKNFCFGHLIRKVNAYCETCHRRARANVVRRCYDSRWELLNNVLLFILTTTQTWFSVLAYSPKGA